MRKPAVLLIAVFAMAATSCSGEAPTEADRGVTGTWLGSTSELHEFRLTFLQQPGAQSFTAFGRVVAGGGRDTMAYLSITGTQRGNDIYVVISDKILNQPGFIFEGVLGSERKTIAGSVTGSTINGISADLTLVKQQ